MKAKRESRYIKHIRQAYYLVREQIPNYTHRNSPKRYTQPQLLAVVMLGFQMNLSYRDMEEYLLSSGEACQAIGLAEVPDHSTLQRAYARLRVVALRQLNALFLRARRVEATVIAIDSTGFSLTQASVHYRSRSGIRYKHYVKAFFGVDTQTQFILDWRFDWGPQPDSPKLKTLRRGVHPYGKQDQHHRARWHLLADKGFDCPDARAHDLIPPLKGTRRIVRADRRVRDAMVCMARLDGLMGQRWKAETVNSVTKRKSGDSIRSRKPRLQHREIGVKVLNYNLHRWIVHFLCTLLRLNYNLATEQLKPHCLVASARGMVAYEN